MVQKIAGANSPITSRVKGIKAKSNGGGRSGTTSDFGASPVFTAVSPPGGTHDVAYTYTFAATGTAVVYFEVSSGSLPAGLTLNTTTGVLSGTPTTAATYTFKVRARNSFYPAVETATKTVIIA